MILILCLIIVTCTKSMNFGDNYKEIFFNTSEEYLFSQIEEAESVLKIYVYGLPTDYDNYQENHGMHYDEGSHRWNVKYESHFWLQEYFPYYLEHLRNANKHDSNNSSELPFPALVNEKFPYLFNHEYKPVEVVSDPEMANVFLIHHQCFGSHMSTLNVMENIVMNYPYFNRSSGYDHFMFGIHDWSLRCETAPERLWQLIENVSIISNYGMSNETFQSHWVNDWNEEFYNPGWKNDWGTFNQSCFKPGHDIVVPQILNYDKFKYIKQTNQNKLLLSKRKYDSCFQGRTHYLRYTLNWYNANKTNDYNNGCELYQQNIDLSNCLAGYMPCGRACWSTRLFDSILKGTIPILIQDKAVLPFEKFINYKTFTIKLRQTTFDNLGNDYRFKLRNESMAYRNSLDKLINAVKFMSMNVNSANWNKSIESISLSPEKLSKPQNNEELEDLKENFMFKKMLYGQVAIDWLQLNDVTSKRNAFRMLVLEMYCRLLHYRKDFNHQICERNSDFTSHSEYMYN